MVRRQHRNKSRNTTAASLRQNVSLQYKQGPAYITRDIPFYNMLEEEGLVKLESQANWLIEEIGLEFRDDPEALEIWKNAGANVQGTRVRADSALIRELCKTAPEQFIQHAKNPDRSVTIGAQHQVFAPVYGSPFVRDYKNERRYGTIADFEKLVKLTYMLPALHHGGFVTCEPCDVPVSKRHLDMLYIHMTASDKPHLGSITQMANAQDSVAMARILHGNDVVNNQCVIMGNVNTNSPLLIDKVVTQAAQVYCGAGQGLIAAPFILGGAMGPVTTAASIAQALAEAMMVCAFTQAIRPGAPFILGNFLSSMNLRSGSPTFGMPEPVMSNFIIAQLARRLKLPLRCGGSLTAAKVPDAQSAYESADSMFSTAMCGANYVLHAAGWLESGLCTSYEKLILDADRLGAYQVLLSGMNLDENAIGKAAYTDTEPGGHFLGSSHTLANYKTAYYEAEMSDSNSYEQWQEHGSQDSYERAYKRWNAMLEEYQPPELDVAKQDELKEFVTKRKSEIVDAWY